MKRSTPEFGADAVRDAVRGALGHAQIELPTHLSKGYGNENWQLRTERETLLCKIGRTGTPVEKWRAAARGRELAEAAGVPVPRLLYATESCEVLDGRMLRVFEFVEGCHPSELAADALGIFWAELGAAVKRLHTIELHGFSSRLDGSAPWFETWDAYLDYRIPQIQERIRATECFEPDSVEVLWDEIRRAAHTCAPYIEPRLTHRDLHLDNVIATPSGHLAAIIDFDQSEAWDPAADFFKLELLSFERNRHAREAFYHGYGNPEIVHPGFRTRLYVAATLELVNQLANVMSEDSSMGDAWGIDLLKRVLREAEWTLPAPKQGQQTR